MTRLSSLITTADDLFHTMTHTVRIFYHPANPDTDMLASVRIVLDNAFCIWFFKKPDGSWYYDGWEAGDYTQSHWQDEL